MGMSYKSPLGRLPGSRPVPEARGHHTPEHIRLPDGRRVAVADILVKPQNRTHYNLRTGKQFAKKRLTAIDRTREE
jgi:hypothetical protein